MGHVTMKLIDIKDRVFGKLTVLNFSHLDANHHRYWMCRCECGKIYPVKGSHLLHTGITSCGCYKTHSYQEISGSYWGRCKKGALSRNFEFSITIEYGWDLFIKQNRKCALTGRIISFTKPLSIHQTASLDRIDSTKGYTIGNVCWLHKDINMFKGVMHSNNFIALCHEVVNYQKQFKLALDNDPLR